MTPAEEYAALSKAHAILRGALRAVPVEVRPPAPWHAGGPALSCPAPGHVGVSLWCAELLGDRAARGEKKESSRIRALVDDFLEEPRMVQSPRSPEAKLHQQLAEAGTALESDSAPLACMRRAASGAATSLRGKPDLVFSSASASVLPTVKELTLRPQPMRVKDFLAQLDHRLMREELSGAFKERMKKPALALAEVLFRAADAKGKRSCFVARLERGHYGVLVRLQAKAGTRANWTWVEGVRDDVLATVPDELFEAATQRVLETERAPSSGTPPSRRSRSAKAAARPGRG